MITRPQLSILVVSYNTRQMTLECLRSVYAETHDTNFEIIVVDNESQDGSARAITQEFPGVKLILPGENLGFARANNLAAKHACGEHILLLNPDTVILDRAIDRLMAFAKNMPDAKIWGGRTYLGDGTLDPHSCWQRMTFWNVFCRTSGLTALFPNSPIFNSEAYGGWNRDSVQEVDIVTGCFFLIRKNFWKELDGFDPRFFMYGEEADLCLRARKLGARPMITPDANIIHYGGASETVRVDKMVRLLKAKSTLILRHWHPALRWFGLHLFSLWPLTRIIALAILVKVFGQSQKTDQLKTWSDIWKARKEWLAAYSV